MHDFRKSALFGAATFTLFALAATDALACKPGHCRVDQGIGGRMATPRHGCNQLINIMYPDLKGRARKAERKKCLADPDSYSKPLAPS